MNNNPLVYKDIILIEDQIFSIPFHLYKKSFQLMSTWNKIQIEHVIKTKIYESYKILTKNTFSIVK